MFSVFYALVLLLPFSVEASSYIETETYTTKSIEGFSLYISPEAGQHAEKMGVLLGEISKQLRYIKAALPGAALDALIKVPFWVEWTDSKFPGAVFHPSAKWLVDNGYNPDKAGGIQISSVNRFIDSSKRNVTTVLLHELSHAYHHSVLGIRNISVINAYENARRSGLYASVPYYKGFNVKAYALKNKSEYFAEISEAYFGKNDYYPFNRLELREYDPVGYKLMTQMW